MPYVTGSIIVDLLKQEVTARCGDVTANAITLGFVQDQPKMGKLTKKQLKDEYARRITEGVANKKWQWLADIDKK